MRLRAPLIVFCCMATINNPFLPLLFLQECSDHASLNCAVDLIKFLTRLYRHVPEFTKFAYTSEFVEALSSTLFPPPLPPSKLPRTPSADAVEQETEKGYSEWVSGGSGSLYIYTWMDMLDDYCSNVRISFLACLPLSLALSLSLSLSLLSFSHR